MGRFSPVLDPDDHHDFHDGESPAFDGLDHIILLQVEVSCNGGIPNIPISSSLVGGFKHEWMIFQLIKKGCHPKPIDFHSIIFQDGGITPPTSIV